MQGDGLHYAISSGTTITKTLEMPRFKEPLFWYKKSVLAYILSPLGFLYQWGSALRLKFRKGYQSELPVICIGNVNVGGVGKTPLVLWVADYLKEKGYVPHIITRGYGRKRKGDFQVNASHTVEDVGDEAMLMHQYHPVWVADSREETAKLVKKSDATHILLDDGMQDPALCKDLTICVVDGKMGFGNGFGIPAGPLRESIKSATKRIDMFCIMGKVNSTFSFGKPVCNAFLESVIEEKTQGKKAIAFAGIGRPEKFFESLTAIECVEKVGFPDHYVYSSRDIEQLRQKAKKENAFLVTTEKDFVRIPDPKDDILCVKARLRVLDADVLKEKLDHLIK